MEGSRRRSPWRGPGVRLHGPGASDLQSLHECRDRRGGSSQSAGRSGRSWAGMPSRRFSAPLGQGATVPPAPSRKTRGSALFLWTLQSTATETADDKNDGPRKMTGRRGGTKTACPAVKSKGLHAGLRCRAPLRAAARHPAAEVGGPRHRTKSGIVRLLPARERARQLSARWRPGCGRAAEQSCWPQDQSAAGMLPRLTAAQGLCRRAAAGTLGGINFGREPGGCEVTT